MAKEASKAPRSTVQLVCVGKTRSKTLLCWVFRLALPNGQAGEERIYSQKSLKSVRIGSVYEVDADPVDSTRIYVDSARWLRLWENKEEAAVWQTSGAAFDTLELARKHEQQQTSRRLPLELLRPIREQYWQTNAAGKLAIELRVLAYLRLVSIHNEES
jgi:hypothetical protein